MPLPTTIADLSTTAGSNFPAGSDAPSSLDDTQRAHASFIAKLRDLVGLVTGTYVPATAITNMGLTPAALGAAPIASPTFTGTVTSPSFSGALTGNVTGNVSGSAASSSTSTTQARTDNSTNIATTAMVQSASPGGGQTPTSFVGSRVIGTIYTNSTGKPFMLNVAANTATNAQLLIAGVVVSYYNSGGIWNGGGMVPVGATYQLTSGAATITTWTETV